MTQRNLSKGPKDNNHKQIDSKVAPPVKYITINNLEVVNQSGYDSFMQMASSPWVTSKRYYLMNFGNITLDLLIREKELAKLIYHLPIEEQRFILACRYIVHHAYLKITDYKNIALGRKTKHTQPYLNRPIDDTIIIENRKADIIALFGKMYSLDEVHRIVTQDWKIDITFFALENFRAENLDKIIELQKEYSNNYNDVRLGYKKSRLEEYMWLYNETKQQYENTNSKDDRRFLKELLESIKREVDGDVIRIEGDLQVNIEHTLNVHVQREIYNKLPINEIIITRVALRTGINPLLLLYRLQNSYYAKFSGFKPKDVSEDGYILPEYPSSHHYDLDKLTTLNNMQIASESNKKSEFDSFIEVSSAAKENAKSLKQIIAERIKSRQSDLDKGITQVNK